MKWTPCSLIAVSLLQVMRNVYPWNSNWLFYLNLKQNVFQWKNNIVITILNSNVPLSLCGIRTSGEVVDRRDLQINIDLFVSLQEWLPSLELFTVWKLYFLYSGLATKTLQGVFVMCKQMYLSKLLLLLFTRWHLFLKATISPRNVIFEGEHLTYLYCIFFTLLVCNELNKKDTPLTHGGRGAENS